jgi:hypothetical protein
MITLERLMAVIKDVHSQYADDVCWMDIDKIFEAAGLPVPDRRVGDKEAMKRNCAVFVDTMCQGGAWKSYRELEDELLRHKQGWEDTKQELLKLKEELQRIKEIFRNGQPIT